MIRDGQYPNRKDKRRQYYGCQAFDSSCRCHGSCGVCQGNRRHSTDVKKSAADEQIREFVEQPA